MGFSGEIMPFLHRTAFFTKIAFLRIFQLYDHYETFTSLFYFWKTNILKKSLEFYLYFENLSFLTNFGFSRGCTWGFLALWSLWNFYIPILLLKDEHLKKKFGVLSQFWKFEFFNKFWIFRPPGPRGFLNARTKVKVFFISEQLIFSI